MHICKTCYREFEEKDMARYATNEISEMCLTCKGVLDKGPGYAHSASINEEEWFNGLNERKKKLEEQGKL